MNKNVDLSDPKCGPFGAKNKPIRKALIVSGYAGLVAIIVGIYILFINQHDSVGTFNSISEATGAVVLGLGALLMVMSAVAVRRWFKR
jgi:hypothetical protein